MTDCIFCKIVNREIPAHKVYEDEDNLAFLDVHPHTKGHVVVIPKTHVETVFDLEDEKIKSLMVAVKETMGKIQKVLDPDGFNTGWNHNQAGGQVVPHLHIHILPRYSGDKGGSMHSIVRSSSPPVEEVAGLFEVGAKIEQNKSPCS